MSQVVPIREFHLSLPLGTLFLLFVSELQIYESHLKEEKQCTLTPPQLPHLHIS